MILVFGSINIDLVAVVDAIPRPGETVLASRYETGFGGKGANQAVAAARASGGGPKVMMASAVGADAFGKQAVDNLALNGVDTAGVATVAAPTGCAFIAVDRTGENAITVASGANALVRAEAVPDAVLHAARVVVLQMEVPLAQNLLLARRAAQAGARLVLNLAPAPADAADAELGELLGLVDVLVVNEIEAAALLDSGSADRTPPAETAERIAVERQLTCIMTLGSQGAVAVDPAGRVQSVAAPSIRPVDTTGAGDTFVGILATELANDRPLAECLIRACTGAALSCLALGAQAGMPDAAAIGSALESLGKSFGESLGESFGPAGWDIGKGGLSAK